MSNFYIYKKKTYDPKSKEPFKLSRSKIDLFVDCPRCYYLDAKLGVGRPQGPAFTLNSAVDHLLKKEFDAYRAKGDQHPLMKHYKLDAIPFAHKDLDIWRENFKGIQHLHKPTNFLITGAVDDVWINKKGELHVVDYKATSKAGEIKSLDDTKWHNQYRRQIEIYQWLLRQIGFDVSDTGYFVYVNGKKDLEAFDGKLEFDVNLISHIGKDDWIEGVLLKIKKALDSDVVPKNSSSCDYCKYREDARQKFVENHAKASASAPKSKTKSQK